MRPLPVTRPDAIRFEKRGLGYTIAWNLDTITPRIIHQGSSDLR